MPLYVSETKYELPPEGMFSAVCIDVTPEKQVPTAWGLKTKFRLVWAIDAKREDGTPFIIGRSYTPSLHEKAQLRKDLTSWRGKPFTAAELAKFDVEKVLGASCKLVIQHKTAGEREFANIVAVMKHDGGTKVTAPDTYVRVKDREDVKTEPAAGEEPPPDLNTDENIF